MIQNQLVAPGLGRIVKLIFAATESSLADAWAAAFEGVSDVEIHRGSIFDVTADALVSPANSFGFMDGGIDALYSERFGWDLQLKLRRRIFDRHHGELLIGSAEVAPTDDARHPYLIAAPTMRVPMVLEPATINPFLATRAVLRLVRHDRFADGPLQGEPIGKHLKTIAFPGMGTGVGRVSPAICARQMRAALDAVFAHEPRMPSSWAEASELHQRLYTDRPKRLQ